MLKLYSTLKHFESIHARTWVWYPATYVDIRLPAARFSSSSPSRVRLFVPGLCVRQSDAVTYQFKAFILYARRQQPASTRRRPVGVNRAAGSGGRAVVEVSAKRDYFKFSAQKQSAQAQREWVVTL